MSTSPAKLSTLINFYTSCLVGVIQNASPLEDLHISHMVPSLIRALESGVRTFVLSAFVVLNFMMAKTKLKPKVVKSFVKKALKVSALFPPQGDRGCSKNTCKYVVFFPYRDKVCKKLKFSLNICREIFFKGVSGMLLHVLGSESLTE